MSEGKKYYCFCSSNCKYETMTKEQILTAIAQAAETGLVTDPNGGFITKVKEGNAGGYVTFWVGTQAQFNALSKHDSNCMYVITDSTKDADIAREINRKQYNLSWLSDNDVYGMWNGTYTGIEDENPYNKPDIVDQIIDEVTADTRAEVRKLQNSSAPAIVNSATGEIVSLTDSAEHGLRGLVLYGKSTQDGTPTPESPVAIVPAGANGDIAVAVHNGNLLSELPPSQNTSGIVATNNGDGSYTFNGTTTGYWVSQYVDIKLPAGDYSLTAHSAGVQFFVRAFDEEGKTVANWHKNFTISGTEYRIAFFMQIPTDTTVNATVYPMLNVGTTLLPWEKGTKQTLTAQTPNGLHEHDYIDFERGVRVQCTKEAVLKGTENYELYTNSTYNSTQIRLWADYGQKYNESSSSLSGAYCNYFEEVTPNQSYMGTHNGFCMDAKGKCISFNYSGFIGTTIANIDDWKNYVKSLYDNGNPIIIRYQLAEPYETDLPDDEGEELQQYYALHTNYPVTTILNDGGAEMKVSYMADTKNYIDKKFNELSTALLALGG